jgi:SSS family solute:Na+ symporter
MQTILLFLGAVLVIVVVSLDFGGFGWFPTEWHDNWDTQPLFSLDPSTRVTVFGAMLTVFVWQVCTAGGDQVSVQRFMSTKDAAAARRSFATQMTISIIVPITLCLVGFALLGFFQAHPESLPKGMNLKTDADKIFPLFIAFHLPVGVSGLVVSAMFAAAMSSIDSGVNSITAVVMTDVLDRFGKKPETEREHVFIARLLAFGIGITVVVGSLFVGRIPGNITEVTNKTVNLMVPMIFSLFFFALFVPFSKPAAVWIGWACGMTVAVLIAFSGSIFGVDPVSNLPPVSFQWIGPASLAVNVVVGLVASLVIPQSSPLQTLSEK